MAKKEVEINIGEMIDGFVNFQREAISEVFKAVDSLISPEARAHARQARKNWAKSWRVLLNVPECEKKASSGKAEEAESSTGPKKVKVVVE
jgi:hypothetical protein